MALPDNGHLDQHKACHPIEILKDQSMTQQLQAILNQLNWLHNGEPYSKNPLMMHKMETYIFQLHHFP